MGIVPKGYAMKVGDKFSEHPIGTGAYVFSKYIPDVMLELTANKNYFGNVPRIKKLIFSIVKDDNVRALKVIKGDVDLVQNAISPMLLKRVASSPHIKVKTADGIVVSYLGFNLRDKILSHPMVRRAIAHAIDRDEIIGHRFKGLASKANSILSPTNWAYNKRLGNYDYDIKKANDLLDEAGFVRIDGKTRFEIEYKTSENAERVDIAHMIAHQLAKVGIAVMVRPYEWGKFYSDIKNGNFQMYSLSWSLLTEPDIFYDICHSSQMPPKGLNRDGYRDTKVDSLVAKARTEPNIEKRKADYAEVQKAVFRDLPFFPLWYEKNVVVYRDYLKDVSLRHDGSLSTLAYIHR